MFGNVPLEGEAFSGLVRELAVQEMCSFSSRPARLYAVHSVRLPYVILDVHFQQFQRPVHAEHLHLDSAHRHGEGAHDSWQVKCPVTSVSHVSDCLESWLSILDIKLLFFFPSVHVGGGVIPMQLHDDNIRRCLSQGILFPYGLKKEVLIIMRINVSIV